MKKEKTFPEITLKYLTHLSKNNNREWFENNRDRFTSEFLEPAMQFVIDMGEKLTKLSPDLHYIPKIDKSIFRLHRDVRFSKDKSPFKTNLGIFLWEGYSKKMECSGYYFHLEPGNFFLGTGMYMFTKEQLNNYRNIVADHDSGKELKHILAQILKNKNYKLGGKTFKRIPKGFDADYEYADLLLHNGIYIYFDGSTLSKLKNNNILDFSYKIYKDMNPLHKWLVSNIR